MKYIFIKTIKGLHFRQFKIKSQVEIHSSSPSIKPARNITGKGIWECNQLSSSLWFGTLGLMGSKLGYCKVTTFARYSLHS
jgi:hypothetical protein